MKGRTSKPHGFFAGVASVLAICTGVQAAQGKQLTCDASLMRDFKPDALTTVVAVKAFHHGDWLVLAAAPNERTPKAEADLCLVKLVVGPGNPGPADAPSTSPGIGIEIWLPAKTAWNGRIHALGGNGWSGGNAGSATLISNAMSSSTVAAREGAVVSTTDSGHNGTNPAFPDVPTSNGAFALGPDGAIAKAQFRDFSWRSLEQQALKTKALASAYYGRAPLHSYFDGTSQGGRQGFKLAQELPDLYDGIVATTPAMNWMRLGLNYAQQVFERDLDGQAPSEEQQDLIGRAAIQACDVVGGVHLGFIMDNAACRYDPSKDTQVLCRAAGGSNDTPACINRAQALAFDKIWYGMTADGSAPSPDVDNGVRTDLSGPRRWYGYSRGASLYSASLRRVFPSLAKMPKPGPGNDMVAVVLQNPTMAPVGFVNATGNGAGFSRTLTYEQFDNVLSRALALQPVMEFVNTDNPDLTKFKARGGKLLTAHGWDDVAIPPLGSIRYYDSVVARLGGLAQVQSFYKLYMIPGIGHQMSMNGTANVDANPPVFQQATMYQMLVDWVEKGLEPNRMELESPPGRVGRITQPACPYPQKPIYTGGDPKVSSSFACRDDGRGDNR